MPLATWFNRQDSLIADGLDAGERLTGQRRAPVRLARLVPSAAATQREAGDRACTTTTSASRPRTSAWLCVSSARSRDCARRPGRTPCARGLVKLRARARQPSPKCTSTACIPSAVRYKSAARLQGSITDASPPSDRVLRRIHAMTDSRSLRVDGPGLDSLPAARSSRACPERSARQGRCGYFEHSPHGTSLGMHGLTMPAHRDERRRVDHMRARVAG